MTEIAPNVQVNTYRLEDRVRALELSAVSTVDDIAKRLDTLEDKLEDVNEWIESITPHRWTAIVESYEERIAALEAKNNNIIERDYQFALEITAHERRITALEEGKHKLLELSKLLIAQDETIDLIETRLKQLETKVFNRGSLIT